MRKTALQRAIGILEKRIERLEELNSEPVLIPGLVWVESVDQEQKDAMTSDQRIVEDHYEDEERRVVMACERITKDPGDVGKVFQICPGSIPGCHARTVLRSVCSGR
jgi:hypothetical protein